MSYIILGSIWFGPTSAYGMGSPRTIGIVAVKSYQHPGIKDYEWKCYIGLGIGIDEAMDEQFIAAHGTPLGTREAAVAFFSQLDPNDFRY